MKLPINLSPPLNLTINALQQSYKNGDFTPSTLIAELLTEAKHYPETWIHLLSAEEVAPYVKALENKTPEECPLWGVPFAIKDNIDLAGVPTTAACPEFSYVADKSAYVVQQLIDAGAIPLGKTNLDQFATGLVGTRSPYGAAPNSFNPEYISGGSSSGSSIATAVGLVSFALGTDTAGSGRVPACFNNLVGLKPSKGLLSTTGVVPACRSLDCVSIFSLTAEDAQTVFAVAAKFDDSDGFARQNPLTNQGAVNFPAKFTFAVPLASQLAFFGSDQYQTAYQDAIKQLEAIGGSKVEVDFAPLLDAAKLLYEGPWVAERYVATEDIISNKPEAMMDVTRTIISAGDKPKATDAFNALYKLQDLKQLADKLMADVDVFMSPTAGRHFTLAEIAEEPILRNSQLGYYTNFMNLLDFAAIAVPTSFTAENMPFGVTLFGPAMTDQKLLTLATRLRQHNQLPLGATKIAYQATASSLAPSAGYIDVVVAGAHLSGMPLNWQLTERGAIFKSINKTSANYQMYAVTGAVERPALIRTSDNGCAFEVEVWSMPISEFGSFVQGIAAPLGIGQVELETGDILTGFIAEGYAAEIGTDISEFGGWRGYCAAR
ncbi:allophanate hydrolase [Paraglaciecola aquimarina]|uniref:Allophanate hydrolase n=1 Tax=Paraglaciecola aquimarina TaxID=1235557 RepID=A0ABU3SVD6_9ALTE|nr:allophanate hydrolase [Paraglaciecola aquimarina]MDU0353948.1 allophanate hydrolase [Paraglaciecola aquimarina]